MILKREDKSNFEFAWCDNVTVCLTVCSKALTPLIMISKDFWKLRHFIISSYTLMKLFYSMCFYRYLYFQRRPPSDFDMWKTSARTIDITAYPFIILTCRRCDTWTDCLRPRVMLWWYWIWNLKESEKNILSLFKDPVSLLLWLDC